MKFLKKINQYLYFSAKIVVLLTNNVIWITIFIKNLIVLMLFWM